MTDAQKKEDEARTKAMRAQWEKERPKTFIGWLSVVAVFLVIVVAPFIMFKY